jgi:hypothetical protein
LGAKSSAIADTVNGRMLSKRGDRMHRFEALLAALPPDCVLDGKSIFAYWRSAGIRLHSISDFDQPLIERIGPLLPVPSDQPLCLVCGLAQDRTEAIDPAATRMQAPASLVEAHAQSGVAAELAIWNAHFEILCCKWLPAVAILRVTAARNHGSSSITLPLYAAPGASSMSCKMAGTGQGQESWTLDKEIAENALAYFEARARNPKARPGEEKWTAVLLLSAGTGISLDWLFIGDPGNLIESLVCARQREWRAKGYPVVLHPKRKTARHPRKVVDLEQERARRRQLGPQGPSDQPAA